MAPRNSSSTNGRRLFSMPSFRRQGPRNRPNSSPASTTTSPTNLITAVENSGLTSSSTRSSLKHEEENPSVIKGWLYKWTNYIKGYQKRWFILENGLLHYYRNKADIAKKSRRCISLHKGHIFTEEGYNFVVSNAGGSQIYHLRASSEEERRKWVTALERAKSKSRTISQSYDADELSSTGVKKEEIDDEELIGALGILYSKLEELRMCESLINKHRHALEQSLKELEVASKAVLETVSQKDSAIVDDLKSKMKTVNERSTLLNITGNAMINASSEFLEHCQNKGKRWQSVLDNEREIRQNLQDMIQQLAKQHSRLESVVEKEHLGKYETEPNTSNTIQTVSGAILNKDMKTTDDKLELVNHLKNISSFNSLRHSISANCLDSELGDDPFEDALDDTATCFNVPVPPNELHNSSSDESIGSSEQAQAENISESFNVVQRKERRVSFKDQDGESDVKDSLIKSSEATESSSMSLDQVDHKDFTSSQANGTAIKKRRTIIPDRPNVSINLWSIMKNCIGKELSKIPFPVNYSEPTSMLQRLTEDFEYSELLDKAAQCEDDCEQLAYVAAFTVSAYATTAIRTGKPFNPLLGETYECDRTDDKHFRCISEQVSHHPPMLAQYCESTTLDSKPGESWKCWQEFTVRSKFRGRYLEIEPIGIAHLVFPKSGNHYTWRKVSTNVHNFIIGKLWVDNNGQMEVINHNTGDKCHMKFEPYSYFGGAYKKVIGTITRKKHGRVEWVLNGGWDSKLEGSKVIRESKKNGKPNLEIETSQLLWQASPPYPGSENFYNMSQFACELNEEENGVAPTDSRLRPDQRLMENGEWEEANAVKVRLEDKQRAVRHQREEEAEIAAQEGRAYEGHQPVWFKKVKDEQNGGKLIFMYNGNYWSSKENQSWENCPDIY